MEGKAWGGDLSSSTETRWERTLEGNPGGKGLWSFGKIVRGQG